MSAPAKRTAHYVVSTHWDREWYESFQDYRARLVSLLDEVLDVMLKDERFAYWQSDGQVILIEDYLEIRPERREQIKSLAEAGRLRLGPWYVLPDEFLVSGESLVRNIGLGLQAASEYGRPSRAGFACDLFGQNSQLPQILRGFSIDNAFIWRGMNESTHGGLFRWQAADGSEVFAYRFSPRTGYCSFTRVRQCFEHGKKFDLDAALEAFPEYLAFEKDRIPTPSLLVFDGGDHIEAEPAIADFIDKVNQTLPDVNVVFSHLDGFMEDVREHRESVTKVFKGELRDPGEVGVEEWVIPGVLSSRIHLKQANARCENELCFWAEPMAAFANRAADQEYPHQYLTVAWKHLIANHPHDSICGCSIDQVHKDMEYRFDQCTQIARRVARESMRSIAKRVKRPADLGDKDFTVTVFNANTETLEHPVDLTLRFPKEWPTFQEWFGYETKPAFRLYDPAGSEVPYQLVAQRRDRMAFYRRRYKFPEADPRTECDITVPLKIGSCGYTTLVCRAIDKLPTRHLGSMATDDHTIENEHLRVSVQCNGAVKLTDKRSKQSFEGLMVFEDCADIGDGWYHGTVVNDQVFSSIASHADVALVADGVAKATLKVAVTMNLPKAFRFGDEMVRSDETAPLRITSYLTLRRNGEFVEVRTVVENIVRDHRLRVLFPTGCKSDTYFADSAYDVVERPIALRKDNARYKELEVETKPQYTWTAMTDASGSRGLAIIAVGQPESAVRDQPDRPIALTLFRSFIKAVLTSGQEGGEIQGTREFTYAVAPFAGKLPRVKLCRFGQRLAAPPRSVQLETRDFTESAPVQTLPASNTFLSFTPGQAVVTAVLQQRGVDGLLVRMFNPGDAPIEETIQACCDIKTAEAVDLEGKPREPLSPSGKQVKVKLKPRQIVTVRMA